MANALIDIGANSQEAESAVLGALLIDSDRLFDIAPLLEPDDFYEPVHRHIYQAILRLHEARTPVDIVTIANAVKDDKRVESAGGSAYLAKLAASVPVTANTLHYAAIVKDKALHRELRRAAETIAALSQDERLSAVEAVEQAERTILAMARRSSSSKPQHIAEIGAESYERYAQLHEATPEERAQMFGLLTGFPALDEMLAGMPPGSLNIVAARPSMGKSSLALDIARHAASEQGKNVALFSLEMTKRELMDRIIAGYLGVEAWKLKKGDLTQEDFERIGALFDQLKRHPIYIDDDPDSTIANLRSKARRQQLEQGLDLLIIDYLQLIEVSDRAAGENRTQQVSHISRSLKNLARELGAPIIALSQLSRSVEQRHPPIPILSDLRESGSIEQDADVVLMLYRQSMHDEDCDDPDVTDIYVRKNRNGPTGRVELRFDKARMSFQSLERQRSFPSQE